MADVVVKVVTRGATITVNATITDNVNVEKAEWALPPIGPTTADFTIHPLDPNAGHLAKQYLGGPREVQIWRDGKCVWWGVPLGCELAGPEALRFHCVHLLWWFLRRYFGPILNNYLDPNSDFEDDLANWTAVGCTAVASTEWRAKGQKSAKLTQAAAGADTYLRRRHTITTTDQDVYLEASALLHLSAAGWVGPAYYERGLYLEVQQPAGVLFTDVRPEWEHITSQTPKGVHEPIRLVKGITVPSPGTFVVEVRLMAPGTTGGAYYDRTRLSPEESTGSLVSGEAAHVVLTRVAVYAQDASWGKSDLFMPVVVEAGSSLDLVRIYQHFDNANIWEAMCEYPKIGACDFDVTWPDDGSSCTFRIWPGTRGAAKPAAVLTLPGNAVKGSGYSVDATRLVSKPRVTGQGRGATRETAEVTDTSATGGHVLESVESAPPESSVDGLWELAAEDLAQNKTPGTKAGMHVPASAVFGEFWLGDSPTPAVDYGGACQESSPRRVKRLSWESRGDSMQVAWD